MLATVGSDNISKLGCGPFVFDPALSNVRTLPNHRATFVFPADLSTGVSKTSIYKGQVIWMEFSVGQETDSPAAMKKGFSLHGEMFEMPPAWKSIHTNGVQEAASAKTEAAITVMGADVPSVPSILVLDYVHLKLDAALGAQLESLNQTASEVSELTGRRIRVHQVPGTSVITIPASWILQDVTAIESSKSSKMATPIIKYPVAFPDLGTKIVFREADDELRRVEVKDFDIVDAGSKVEVLIGELDGQSGAEYLRYSNVYARSKETLLNPRIVKTITPSQASNIKDTYKEEAREYIRSQLSKWGVWTVKGLKVLTMGYSENNSKTPTNVKWMFPLQSIASKDVHVVSFEHGVVTADGQQLDVYLKEKPESEEGSIYYHSLTESHAQKCMYYNASIGTAYSVVGNKRVEAYFSTKNAVRMTTDASPLFRPVEPIERVSIDVVNFKWVMGYLGKSQQEGYGDQTVLYWTEAPEALRNFYTFVVSRGENKLFAGKSVANRRAMFECEEYPDLVDMFNFMVYGVDEKNPTRDSHWTKWFVENVLLVDYNDLL